MVSYTGRSHISATAHYVIMSLFVACANIIHGTTGLVLTNTSPVKIIFTDQTQNIQNGTEVRLNCVASGGSNPITTWVTTVGDLPSNARVMNGGHTLVIPKFEPQDNGGYICVVSDGVSTDQHVFHVQSMTPTTATPITTSTTQSVEGPVCLRCQGVTVPGMCATVTRCRSDEDCSMTQYVESNGQILYDLGCTPRARCNSLQETFGKRGVQRASNESIKYRSNNILTCQACCHGNLCNIGGHCSIQDFDFTRGRLCYSCKAQATPTSCDQIKHCSADRLCMIQQARSAISGVGYWTSGCANSIGNCTYGYINRCYRCCRSNLCNDDCSTQQNSHASTESTTFTRSSTSTFSTRQTPHVVTQSTTVTSQSSTSISATTTSATTTDRNGAKVMSIVISPSEVKYGSNVTVMCVVTGDPYPTITWQMRLPDASANPNNVVVGLGGALLTFQHYSPANDGDYRCHASNFKDDIKVIHLHGE